MPVCAAIKPNGERCKGAATGSHGYCWSHAPENAAVRRKQASRAARGKASGAKEVRALKTEIKGLIDEVKVGELDRNDAGVMIQGFRTLKDLIELERRIKETEELEERISVLESTRQNHTRGGNRWG
jgi:hypothetical protein